MGGAAAGLAGGLLASWLMVVFQRRIWPALETGAGASSTARCARGLAALDGRSLNDEQAEAAGDVIHYALGAGLGFAYGATAEFRPEVTAGAGLAFGLATECVIDQTMVPALGLSGPFWKYPPEAHARGVAAHLVFGLATEVTRRLLRPGIGGAATGASSRP